MPPTPDEFTGFPQEGLDFLTTLGAQDKRWFDKNRSAYEEFVVGPTKAFVAEMTERLQESISAAIVGQPKTNGSIAPINNDLRFSPEKSPYKDHLLLKWWEGANKKSAPTLHIRLSADSVGFATGTMFPDVERWRALVDDPKTGDALVRALDELGARRHLDLAGEGLKRVPKPFAADHPREKLLRHKMIQARWPEPTPKSVTSARFVDYCMKRMEACADVHRWFVANL